jgi:hypothetical protein
LVEFISQILIKKKAKIEEKNPMCCPSRKVASGTVWPSWEESGPVVQARWGIKEIFVESFACTKHWIENLAAIEQIHPDFCVFLKDDLRDFSEVLCTHNLDD